MATDLNVMATNIKSKLTNVQGIAAAYDHEPQTMSSFPAATLYFDGFSPGSEETIGRVSLDWRWTVRLYVLLNTSDVQQPQLTVRNLLMGTLAELRKDFRLNNTCLYHTVSNGDVFAVLDQPNPMMVVEFTLTATTEENING